MTRYFRAPGEGATIRDNRDSLVLREPSDLAEARRARLGDSYRIGLLIPMSGSAGIWGPSCISCAQLAVAEMNRGRGIRGRRLELILVDAAIEGATTIEARVNALIETRAIDAIVGMHISSMRQKLSKIVRQRVPYVYTPLYEGGETTPGIFAIGDTPDRQLGPALRMLQRAYRPRNWALLGNDYVWPRSFHHQAKRQLREQDATIVCEDYLPFGLGQMDQVVERLAATKADAVLVSLVGQDGVDFNRAFGRAGLHRRLVRLTCVIEENGLMASGVRNSQRLFSASSYFGSLQTEANAAFKEAYYALHGDDAPTLNMLGQSTYEGMYFLGALMESDPLGWRAKIYEHTRGLRYRSARWLGERDGAPAPIYLARAEGLMYDVLKT